MARDIPFDDDTMTLFMGLGGPDKPGQHGRTMIPAPEQNAIDFATQIRDLCEEFLQSFGKETNSEEKTERSEESPTEEPLEEE